MAAPIVPIDCSTEDLAVPLLILPLLQILPLLLEPLVLLLSLLLLPVDVLLAPGVVGLLPVATLGLLVEQILTAFLLLALEPLPLRLLLPCHVARLVARHATTTAPAAPASVVRRIVLPVVGRRVIAPVRSRGAEARIVPEPGHAAGRQDDAQERGGHNASHGLPVPRRHATDDPHLFLRSSGGRSVA